MENYWENINGISAQTLAKVRHRVENLMSEGACENQYPQGSSKGASEAARFTRCVETALEENWNVLSEQEKVRIRFPFAKKIGDKTSFQNRGVCEIIRQKLTKRFGLLVTYRSSNGNMFDWEHID